MKILFFFLISLISSNLLAVDFRSFSVYKNNNALLASDIERLEALVKSDSGVVFADTLKQFKLLEENYVKLNSQLSLNKFSIDALDSGWRMTSLKLQELVSICEGREKDLEKCTDGLNALKEFITNSRLKSENKNLINSFFDSYLLEKNQLIFFDKKYVESFDSNVEKINHVLSKGGKAPITIKMSRPKIAPSPARVFINESNESNEFISPYVSLKTITYFFLAAIILGFFLLLLKSKMKKIEVQKFYARLFQLGYKNKCKVRIFGLPSRPGMGILKKIENPFVDSLKFTKNYTSEIHIKVKSKSDSIKVDTIFHTHHSLNDLLKNEEALKSKMEALSVSVIENKGDMHFTSNLDTAGEFTSLTLSINLPLS